MLFRSIQAGSFALLIASTAAAQSTSVPFPLEYAGFDGEANSHRMANNADAILQLELYQELRLTGVPTPQGELIEVDLKRVSTDICKFGFYVDGEPRPNLLDGLGLTVWAGEVVGSEDSEVMMSFSLYGSRGWIRNEGTMTHLMPHPSGDNDWGNSWTYIVDEQELLSRGNEPQLGCQSDALFERPTEAGRSSRIPYNTNLTAGSDCGAYECTVAMETDYQLFQIFGALNPLTTYMASLLAYGSSRYTEQINTTLTYPYIQFYTSSNDPWIAQDGGGSSIDVLYEFQAAWVGNIPNDCTLGHFLSGAGLGGGVAWLNALCDNTYNFGVSGNLDGNLNFPVSQGPNQWDAMVWLHEIGHNFNGIHTHDYCPPVDECSPDGYFGSCQNQQVCTNQGTIMSYCHLCPGGTANVTTFFHPTSVSFMQAAAAGCLPTLVPISVEPPTLSAPGVPITVTANITGLPLTGTYPEVFYGYGGTIDAAVAMTDQGGGVWTADLPGASCDDQPEFYVSYVDTSCGTVTIPATAPTETFAIEIGVITELASDDLESNSGWVAGDPSDTATTGIWERVNPIGTDAQPDADHSPGGSFCFVTGQGSNGGSLGENDVDGGTTTLYSPIYDLSGSTTAEISYWRWYSNSAGASPGADTFIIQLSNDGGSSWSDVEVIGPTGPGTSGGWIQHSFLVASVLTPTASMQLRFLASDLGSGSIIEAAIDDLQVVDKACDGGTGVGTSYCQSGPNGSVISASGSASVSSNDLTLLAENIPNNTFGLFYFGDGQANAPLGNGTRCVSVNSATTRLGPPLNSGSSGVYTRSLDLPQPSPAGSTINPGSTWYFQAWFRDGSSSDLTDGLEITFTP